MAESPRSGKPRCVVIGLDGLTFDLLDPWMKEGLLPNLSGIAARGARGVLKSLQLPLSPPAWTTITTGKNPGGHGVFGFLRLRPGGYETELIDERTCRAPRLWDHVGRAGLRVGVFNAPVTWPPREVNGYLVGCFMTPDVTKTFTHPEALGRELHEAVGGYRTWTSQVYSPSTPLPYVQELGDLVRMRVRAIEHLFETRPVDFGMFVFMESDWLQHKVWHVLTDPTQEASDLAREARTVYEALDAAVGRIRDLAGPDCNVLVVSDHGAGPHDRVMYINKWLCDQGFLAMKDTARGRLRRFLERRKFLPRAYRLLSWLRGRFNWIGRLVPNVLAERAISFVTSNEDVDWSRTRAYAREAFGQIFVNLKGREPDGIVSEGAEYEAVLADLEKRLAVVQDPRSGRPIVTKMRRGREAYKGPLVGSAPDLIFVLDDYRCTCAVQFGSDAEGYFGGVEFCDSGAHRPEGILLACGPDIQPGTEIRGAEVADVTPTVLHLMGQPVPSGLDGRPLEDLLTPEFRGAHPVRRTAAGEGPAAAAEPYDEESRAQVEARLKDLGYL
jgi:predicted AlkP superfamily phosphohydrolase/phosphomutase